MRRKLVPLFLSFSLGIFINVLIHQEAYKEIGLILISSVFIWRFFLLNHFKHHFFLVCLIFLVAGFGCQSYSCSKKSSLEPYYGQTVPLKGLVLSAKKTKQGKDLLYVQIEHIKEKGGWRPLKKEKIGLLIIAEKNSKKNPVDNGRGKDKDRWLLSMGKTMTFTGTPSKPDPNRNPHTFNYEAYLKTIKIRALVQSNSNDVKVSKGSNHFFYHQSGRFKYTFIKALESKGNQKDTGVLMGMIFGDKSYLEDTLYDAFQKNGTAHILAVSGLHIGIIYGLVEKIWKGRSKKKYMCISLMLLIYGFLSGFPPSANRAIFMIFLFMLAKVFHKRYDLVTSASFCGLFFLVLNPDLLFNVGFVLSYMAVFSIGIIYPFIKNITNKVPINNSILCKFMDLMALGVAIQVGMAPLIAYYFNVFSPIGILINIPITFLASILLPVGLLLFILSLIGWPMAFDGIYFISHQMTKLLLEINRFTYEGHMGFFEVVSPSPLYMMIYYFCVFAIFSEMIKTHGVKFALSEKKIKTFRQVFLSFCLVIIFVAYGYTQLSKRNEITFIDVGQGDAIHIKTKEGYNILIDGGGSALSDYDVGKEILKPYFLKNGVGKIDLAIITHFHEDHEKGIRQLSKVFPINQIMIYEGYKSEGTSLANRYGKDRKEILFSHESESVKVSEDLSLNILYPEDGQALNENENKNTLITMVIMDGKKILLTSDMIEEEELELIKTNENIKADVIKVPHHGSRFSSSGKFINKVSPQIAIVQVGKNYYGHPSPEVIERYKKKSIMLYRTDFNGGITLFVKNKEIVTKKTIN